MAKKEKPEPVKPSEVEAQIGKNKLRALLRAASSAHKDQREIAGGLGKKIQEASENDHLHLKAFAELRKRDRMTPEKLADYVDTVAFYMDLSGLTERAASAPRLRLEPGAEEEGDGTDKETGGEERDGAPVH